MMGKCLFMRKGEVHTTPLALPSDYIKLAYIKGDGNAYINTLFTANQDTRVVYDMEKVTAAATAENFFGARSGNNSRTYSLYTYNGGWRSGFNTAVITADNAGPGRYLIDKNKNKTTINGVSLEDAPYGAFTTAYSILLFTFWENGPSSSRGTHKLFSCQICDDGTLVRDFIPCINANGEIGLYDLVGKQFYGNAGTGAFVGSEVA